MTLQRGLPLQTHFLQVHHVLPRSGVGGAGCSLETPIKTSRTPASREAPPGRGGDRDRHPPGSPPVKVPRQPQFSQQQQLPQQQQGLPGAAAFSAPLAFDSPAPRRRGGGGGGDGGGDGNGAADGRRHQAWSLQGSPQQQQQQPSPAMSLGSVVRTSPGNHGGRLGSSPGLRPSLLPPWPGRLGVEQ